MNIQKRLGDEMNMTDRESLFERINELSEKTRQLGGVVQNPMLPTDINPLVFRNNVIDIITELEQWEKDVSTYYRDMTPEEQKYIKDLQNQL